MLCLYVPGLELGQVKGTNVFKVPEVAEEEEHEEEVPVIVPPEPVAVPKKPVAVPKKPVAVPKKQEAPLAKGISPVGSCFLF